jgi:hypothetical protein
MTTRVKKQRHRTPLPGLLLPWYDSGMKTETRNNVSGAHMPVQEKIPITAGAWISFSSLPATDQEQIMATLLELLAQPPEQWPKEKVRRLSPDLPLYTFLHRVPPEDELFVTFRREEGGGLTLVDLTLKEMILRNFSGKKP